MAICNMKPVTGQFTLNYKRFSTKSYISLRPCLAKNPPLGFKSGICSFHAPEKEWLLSLDIYVYMCIYVYKYNIRVHNMIDKAKKHVRPFLKCFFCFSDSIHSPHISKYMRKPQKPLQIFLLQDTNEIQSSRKTLRFSNGNS